MKEDTPYVRGRRAKGIYYVGKFKERNGAENSGVRLALEKLEAKIQKMENLTMTLERELTTEREKAALKEAMEKKRKRAERKVKICNQVKTL